ncbi:MAG TPA: peptidoglycan-binding domain-containing protein [Candidatus Omnitrophota bacterium]|nr:peptidoglycan-binding domain-containing protein [Candidatus Omnitrophota bacterium]HPT07615.1 peptidoglycan-binding domain-containing protein [Candidatus Omnitrophota bacterium]
MKNTLYVVLCALLLAGCASAAKRTTPASTTIPESNAYDLSSQVTTPEATTASVETSTATVKSTRTPLSLSKKEIQTALKKAGFYNGPVDGVFGPQSRKAIKAFQKAKGLGVDGLAGMKTREALLNYVE